MAAAIAAGALAACSSAIQIGQRGASSAASASIGSAGSTGTTLASGTGGTAGASTGSGSTAGDICDPSCPPQATCESNGVCLCPVAGYDSCADGDGAARCVDLLIDDANCGSCGRSCPAPSHCSGGSCLCGEGSQPCALDGGFGCFFLEDDPQHCGACNNPCAAPASACIDSACACPGGESLCGTPQAGVPMACVDTGSSKTDCGSCGNACADTFAAASICDRGRCSCATGGDDLCAEIPATDPPTCRCVASSVACFAPGFARDVYPFLAAQSGAFGCAASGCHSGRAPAASLGFLDANGGEDAGMAYAELLGNGDAGNSPGVPACDGGRPANAPSARCACTSRVVAGDPAASYLIDVLTNDLPSGCDTNLAMPSDDAGNWIELGTCANQLIAQWVLSGAPP